MSTNIITGYELLQRVTALGFTDVKIFRDANYFLPSREWLGNTFAPFLKSEFWAYQRAYIKSKFDCEDFAFEAQLEADIDRYVQSRAAKFALKAATRSLVANSEIGDAGHAFLYVEVGLYPGKSLNGVAGPGGHATNLCLHPDGSATLFEPQNSFLTDAVQALDPIQPNEDRDRPSHRLCTPRWAWV